MDSFVTCPGLGTLPETRHVVRETLRAGPVVDDSRTAFALRQSPVDDEFAERTSLRLHVSVTIAGDIAPSATVEDLSSSARAPNLCRFPVKPSGGFHFVLILETGGEKLFSAKWGVSSPIDSGETPTSAVAKADIYQILESFVKQFYENRNKPMVTSRPPMLQ